MSQAFESQARAERVAARLPPLTVAAERLATAVAQGIHGRRRVGPGTTFWQFRPYEPGDPVHRIDWRRSAKADPVFVREREWEAAARVWLWRDASPSMVYRSRRGLPLKRERAELLLLALASLLVRGEEQVGLLGTDETTLGGAPGLERLSLALAAERSGTMAGEMPRPPHLPRFARVILLGDFLGPTAEIEAYLKRYAGWNAQLHLLLIVDPAEESLPFSGRIRFEGLEGEGTVLINRVDSVRAAYIERMRTRRLFLAETARRLGGTFHIHRTDSSPEAALLDLYSALSLHRDG